MRLTARTHSTIAPQWSPSPIKGEDGYVADGDSSFPLMGKVAAKRADRVRPKGPTEKLEHTLQVCSKNGVSGHGKLGGKWDGS